LFDGDERRVGLFMAVAFFDMRLFVRVAITIESLLYRADSGKMQAARRPTSAPPSGLVNT